jgi:SARP family transcriptional regulator, regulator of embCAB operon
VICSATAGWLVTRALPGAQGRLAFAYLVANRTREATRSELSTALWGDVPPPEPGTALRALLSKLRRALRTGGEDALPAGDLLRVRLPSDAWVDLEAAAQALHDAQAAVAQGQNIRAWITSHIALNVSARTFLLGHEGDWISEQRSRLGDVQLQALEALAACSVGLGGPELDTAVRASRQLISLAPFHETGYAWLMRALTAQGNAAEALLSYEALRVLLRDELGAIPGAALQTLHSSLLTPQGSDT